MTNIEPPQSEYSVNQSEAGHQFHPLNPDSRSDIEKAVQIVGSEPKIFRKINDISSETEKMSSNATIFGATLMLTNICLGTTIFTFAIRAKSFGLIWLLVACIITGAINYWSISNCCIASSKCKEDDYSEITERVLGRKMRVTLNIIIIVYSYACMMCFFALIFPLFGRFILSAAYSDKYSSFEDFSNKKWGKAYIKFPFFIGIAFLLSLMCLIKDINKLNFSAYIGVVAVMYTLFVVMIQCKDYYDYYKKTFYVETDKTTHPNWVNLGDAFTDDLSFFKGMANLFAA